MKMKTVVCDICGKRIEKMSPRYELIFHSIILQNNRRDICYSCMARIVDEIRRGVNERDS